MSDCAHVFGQVVCHSCGMRWYGTSVDFAKGFDAGGAALGGLMGMAAAIGENDSVRACPHCGVASNSRCYCDCAMCSPDFCLYWVCRTCFDAGKRFDVKFSSDDRGPAR